MSMIGFRVRRTPAEQHGAHRSCNSSSSFFHVNSSTVGRALLIVRPVTEQRLNIRPRYAWFSDKGAGKLPSNL